MKERNKRRAPFAGLREVESLATMLLTEERHKEADELIDKRGRTHDTNEHIIPTERARYETTRKWHAGAARSDMRIGEGNERCGQGVESNRMKETRRPGYGGEGNRMKRNRMIHEKQAKEHITMRTRDDGQSIQDSESMAQREVTGK